MLLTEYPYTLLIQESHYFLFSVKNALEKLNYGGHLIILVPAHQKIYSKLDKAVGHYKRYDINFFKENFVIILTYTFS